MKKQVMIAALVIGISATVWGQGFPISPSVGGDTVQPIGPVSDNPAGGMQPGPGIPAAAVPGPSTISLLAGGALISSWFVLRRRR